MDTFLIFAAMLMVYMYGLFFYFYKLSKDKKQKNSAMMVRAITHFRSKNFEQAQYFLEVVYNEAMKSEDLYFAAESLYYLALVNIEQKDSQTALQFLEESFDYYKQLEDEEGIQKTQDLMIKL
ncbi:hypothetical protein [Methanobacterium alcaliphilum]|uniref:hypothetical protein n=1 Tax=Methanobacterium alcaliphilum TaxID=392018 RepID=UPI00200B401A|nr:hypothetical protein [Methanobacterium alcaliphilum]MCK9150992.1 hypothetical protein [Methanobacterium alcaliphilum]